MKRYKVRFNLAKGAHYMTWKVICPDGYIGYYSPSLSQLVMTGCTLKNNNKTAQAIYKGGEKVVCAWVLCDNITIKHTNFTQADEKDKSNKISYNPRKHPYWIADGDIADDKHYDLLMSVDTGLYQVDPFKEKITNLLDELIKARYTNKESQDNLRRDKQIKILKKLLV